MKMSHAGSYRSLVGSSVAIICLILIAFGDRSAAVSVAVALSTAVACSGCAMTYAVWFTQEFLPSDMPSHAKEIAAQSLHALFSLLSSGTLAVSAYYQRGALTFFMWILVMLLNIWNFRAVGAARTWSK